MMKSTPEQIDFIRVHGITKCPPSPQIRAIWGGGPDHKRGGWSEEDQLAQMRSSGVVVLHGTNLSERHFGRNGNAAVSSSMKFNRRAERR